jgi:hypothetical protein
MANAFTTEDRTIFKDVLSGFENTCMVSRNVSKYGTEGELMERANDIIHRNVPYILNSSDRTIGSALAAQDVTQLKVPAALDTYKSVPLSLDALQLRDKQRKSQLAKAAGQRLASDIEVACQNLIASRGSLTVAVTGASGDYGDVAEAEALMMSLGMAGQERSLVLNSYDYNGIAGDLSKASRSFGNSKSENAYERSDIGMIAGFNALKGDAGKRIAAAAGSSLTVATNGAQVRFVPTANADNRTQAVTFSATTGMVAGDRFTIAGIEAVDHITKESTGKLKTFVVVSVDSGTVATISPPMIGANSSPTDAETQYKNVNVASTSATAAVVFLNATATNANYFWINDSIEILAGRYAVPSGEGPEVMRGTTDQGIEITMTKEFSGQTYTSLYYFDILFGVANLNPEKNGLILWNQ